MVRACGQDISLAAIFEHAPDLGISTVKRIGKHPGARQAGIQRPRDHVPRHRRLGGKGDIARNMRLVAPHLVRSPVFGQIELTVDQSMTKAAGIAGEDADLAVLDPSSRPRILAADADE